MKAATPALVRLAPTDEVGYGRAAARALGVDESRVYKTLLAQSENGPLVAIVPVNAQLSLKSLAYVVGGISPFGQKRKLPTAVDEDSTSKLE